MVLRPASSTLFPYTTLFRSFVAPDEAAFAWLAGRPFAPQGAQWDAALSAWRALTSDEGAEFEDRKSTRLNSSHANISYAVFCLKTKIIHNVSTPAHVTRWKR